MMKTPGGSTINKPRAPRLPPQEWWRKHEPLMEIGVVYKIEISGDEFEPCNCPSVSFTAEFAGWKPTYEEWQALGGKRPKEFYPDATFSNGVTLSSLSRVTIVTS